MLLPRAEASAHEACTRSSQSTFQHRQEEAHEALPLAEELLPGDGCWIRTSLWGSDHL